jgi:hypothetical protein
MIEELRQVDTTSVEALQALKETRTRLEELVARAEERKAAVSPEIYARVTGDYAKRLAELEAEARPLREKARAELARLMTLHATLQAALAQARLDQEELEFRHTLGELDEKPYAERRDEVAKTVEGCATDFADAEKLRELFAGVLPAGEEPAAAAAPPAPVPPAPAPAAAPAPTPPPPPPVVVAAPRAAAPPPPPPITEQVPVLPEPDAAEATIADTPVTEMLPPPPPVAAMAAAAAARRPMPAPPPPPPPPPPKPKAPAGTDATVVLTPPPPPPPVAPADPGEGTQLVKWARLVLVRPDGGEQVYAIGPVASIGRTRQNDIVIEEADVSRQHAKVALEAGGYVIRDLGSNNGTFVNDEQIDGARALRSGDRIGIGNQVLRFEQQ